MVQPQERHRIAGPRPQFRCSRLGDYRRGGTSAAQSPIQSRRSDPMIGASYPVQFSVDYPDRSLDRLTTALRMIIVIPIATVLGTLAGTMWQSGGHEDSTVLAAGAGLLFVGPLLMILFRRKYPRWWFDWNRELLRFSNRVTAYVALMDDRHPPTHVVQSVLLVFPYPDAPRALTRCLSMPMYI